jgi:tetratricopeptide (TPR) repeat protein
MNALMSRYFQPRPFRAITGSFIFILTAVVFFQSRDFLFINYDDPYLLIQNRNVNTGISLDGLIWAFTSTDLLQWVPLTWISHMIDFQVWGMNAGGHHVSSLVFHMANTALLLLFLYKATGEYGKSAFVAALFALHPLHVEPVVWITARKDLLSTFFLLLSLISYGEYARKGRYALYGLALALFSCSLMAKPMMVTLPAVLLLIDYWPFQRISFFRSVPAAPGRSPAGCATILIEKLPFAVLSLLSAGIAFYTQSKADALSTLEQVPLMSRFSNAVVAYAAYIGKTLWPGNLSVIYPLEPSHSLWYVTALSALLLLASVMAFLFGRRHRYLVTGWFWFLGVLLPVIGIVQIGPAAMADKFTYVPLIGLFIVAAWGVPDLLGRFNPASSGKYLMIAAAAIVLAFSVRSWKYAGCWKDSITLYREAIASTDRNYLAMSNLGTELVAQKRHQEALFYFYESIRAEPRFEVGYYNIGNLFLAHGKCRDAVPFFERAIAIKPGYKKAVAGLNYCLYDLSKQGAAPGSGLKRTP